jgi:hypothetical protein
VFVDGSQNVDSRGDGVAGFAVSAGHGSPALAESAMNVNNVGQSSPVQKVVNNPIHKTIPADAPSQMPAIDRLELSGVSHLLQALKSNSDVRTDTVAEIKAQLEAGTYESEKKFDIAVDRLLDDLLK